MSIIQTEIYDAFIEAGVSETKARTAATVATIPTNYPNPKELVTKAHLRAEIAELKNKLILLIAACTCTTIIIAAIGIATAVIITFIN